MQTPRQTGPALVLTDGEGFTQLEDEEFSFVIVLFTRKEVVDGLWANAVDRLLRMTERPEIVDRYEGRVYLQFDGFDDDPRELGQIPECRRFMRGVHTGFSAWLHFLAPQPFDQLALIESLLLEAEYFFRDEEKVSYIFAPKDRAALHAHLKKATRLLHELHGYAENRAAAVFERYDLIA